MGNVRWKKSVRSAQSTEGDYMNEENNVKGHQVRRTSKWAKIGLYCTLIGCLLAVLMYLYARTLDEPDKILTFLSVLPTLVFLPALIFAVIGMIEVIFRRSEVKGWKYIIPTLLIILLIYGGGFLSLVMGARKVQAMEIHDAVENGSIEAVASLLEENPAMVNLRYHRGWTPLHRIVNITGNKEMIEFLITKGADINAKSQSGYTPLHYAVMLVCFQSRDPSIKKDIDYQAIIECLLQHGADVNSWKDDGETPLGIAIKYDCNDVIELLRKHGGIE